jgi:hypothetical protein
MTLDLGLLVGKAKNKGRGKLGTPVALIHKTGDGRHRHLPELPSSSLHNTSFCAKEVHCYLKKIAKESEEEEEEESGCGCGGGSVVCSWGVLCGVEECFASFITWAIFLGRSVGFSSVI